MERLGAKVSVSNMNIAMGVLLYCAVCFSVVQYFLTFFCSFSLKGLWFHFRSVSQFVHK